MSLRVEQYTGDAAETWDTFVTQSRNGTLFHTRRFLGYHPADRFEDASLLFYKGGKLLAVLPAARKEGRLVSHPGATYGGLVLSSKTGASSVYEIVETLRDYAREQGLADIDLLRLPPTAIRTAYADEQEYALSRLGFTINRTELAAVLSLHNVPAEKVMDLFSVETRSQVRQAERAGMEVRLERDYEAYWPLLTEALGGRHGVTPTHTLTEMQDLAERFPDAIRFYGAYLEGKLVAGVVTADATDRAIYVKYIAQDYAAQRSRPLNAVIAFMLKDAVMRGIQVVNFGVAMMDNEKGINEGIFGFKEGFGARGVLRLSWSLSL